MAVSSESFFSLRYLLFSPVAVARCITSTLKTTPSTSGVWSARQRIEIVDENTALCLAWPRGSSYNARIGSKAPFELEHRSDSEAKEESIHRILPPLC